jgi:hypothetical protein
VTGAFGRSRPDLGDFQPPTLETLPEAVARNVAIARAWTRTRIMGVVKADGYGHGACTVAQGRGRRRGEWLGTTDIAEASELRATGLTLQIPHPRVQDGIESVGRPSFSWPSSALGAREGAETPTHGWPVRWADITDGKRQELSGGAYAWVLDHAGRSLQDRGGPVALGDEVDAE